MSLFRINVEKGYMYMYPAKSVDILVLEEILIEYQAAIVYFIHELVVWQYLFLFFVISS